MSVGINLFKSRLTSLFLRDLFIPAFDSGQQVSRVRVILKVVPNRLQQLVNALSNSRLQVAGMQSSGREVGFNLFVGRVFFFAHILNVYSVRSERRNDDALAVVQNWIVFDDLFRAE